MQSITSRQQFELCHNPRPSFFLCDEFQAYFTTAQDKSDADFFELMGLLYANAGSFRCALRSSLRSSTAR